jgi:hypothetical protein
MRALVVPFVYPTHFYRSDHIVWHRVYLRHTIFFVFSVAAFCLTYLPPFHASCVYVVFIFPNAGDKITPSGGYLLISNVEID